MQEAPGTAFSMTRSPPESFSRTVSKTHLIPSAPYANLLQKPSNISSFPAPSNLPSGPLHSAYTCRPPSIRIPIPILGSSSYLNNPYIVSNIPFFLVFLFLRSLLACYNKQCGISTINTTSTVLLSFQTFFSPIFENSSSH
ncbi:hypothetical protein V8B55DRAFT_1393837 [Mucor lusitanicus]